MFYISAEIQIEELYTSAGIQWVGFYISAEIQIEGLYNDSNSQRVK